MLSQMVSGVLENAEIIQAFGSLFLTSMLVVLYYKQKRIMENQQELMRYEQEPTLEIEKLVFMDDWHTIEILLSNYGGGAATSLTLRLEFYELDGSGPIRAVGGKIRRAKTQSDGSTVKSQSSSIRPNETDVRFSANSATIIRNPGPKSKSFARVAFEELDSSRPILYAKPIIQYTTKYEEVDTYTADFSIKMTNDGEMDEEIMEFLPWSDQNDEQHFTEIKPVENEEKTKSN
ncbi:hypothetical protein [Haloterrigena salina]|uniref:hypothetical protein n=1 Tax=Haloterrigena salina TaxID=504937 RepID=UPI00126914A6|nr:hypothetical protein [Haloterrigena salina]